MKIMKEFLWINKKKFFLNLAFRQVGEKNYGKDREKGNKTIKTLLNANEWSLYHGTMVTICKSDCCTCTIA